MRQPHTATRPVTAVIVGAGHRGVGYAAYSEQTPGPAQDRRRRRSLGAAPARDGGALWHPRDAVLRVRGGAGGAAQVRRRRDQRHHGPPSRADLRPAAERGLPPPAGEAVRDRQGRDAHPGRNGGPRRQPRHGLPRPAVRALLPRHQGAGGRRRDRRRRQRPDRRARQLPSHGGGVRSRQVAPQGGRVLHADGQVLPRPRPDHVAEGRVQAGRRVQLRLAVVIFAPRTRRRARAPGAWSTAP